MDLTIPLLLATLGFGEMGRVRDLEFTRIEIEWVASTGTVRDLNKVLPRRQADLIRQLNCDHYTCRRLAFDELSRMGDEAIPALCWGLRIKSAEVQDACKRLLSPLFLCRNCDGTGECQGCKGLPVGDPDACPFQCDWSRRCRTCDGAGDLRLRRIHSDLYEERDFFAKED